MFMGELGEAERMNAELHGAKQSAKVSPVAAGPGQKAETHGVRLILENSTVCHSRRISLLCPVG
jgi:hypothetical protein